jgi:hypothetical protein
LPSFYRYLQTRWVLLAVEMAFLHRLHGIEAVLMVRNEIASY